MLDENLIMERILKMTPEERRRIMQEALEDSHIECMDGPGEIIFDGFSPEEETLLWESKMDIYPSNAGQMAEQYDSTVDGQRTSIEFSVPFRSEFVLEAYTLAA